MVQTQTTSQSRLNAALFASGLLSEKFYHQGVGGEGRGDGTFIFFKKTLSSSWIINGKYLFCVVVVFFSTKGIWKRNTSYNMAFSLGASMTKARGGTAIYGLYRYVPL